MKQYAMGFAFNPDQTRVALILKNRGPFPGKLNAIGGGLEPGETASAAMTREFFEETGVCVQDWEYRLTSLFADFGGTCFVYRAVLTAEQFEAIRTTTDEQVAVLPVPSVIHESVASDVRWMVPAVLDTQVLAFTVLREAAP